MASLVYIWERLVFEGELRGKHGPLAEILERWQMIAVTQAILPSSQER